MEQANQALQQEEGNPETFNVKVGMDANGNPIMQEVTKDELLNGYLRQSDYTKKTQELAQEREMLSASASKAQAQGYQGDPNDDAAVDAYLAQKGYAKLDKVEQLVEEKMKGLTKSQQDEQSIQSLIASNPDLKQFEGAIRKIAATDDSALEDIVVKYGFTNHDKLSQAKKRGLVGGTNKVDDGQPKPVSERTKDDWAKFEAQSAKSQFR